MREASRRGAPIALGIAGVIVLLLGLAQLLLPAIAAQRVRDKLARYGTVRSASVSAFPALELLWGHAQSASVSAERLSMSPTQVGELLWSARGVQRIDLRAQAMRVGSFTLNDVSARKRGSQLYVSGRLSEANLRESLPGSTGFQLLGNGADGVQMRVSGSLFGVSTSLAVLLSAQAGKLVAQPQGVPLAGLVKVTLLSAPHLHIQSLALADAPSLSAPPEGARVGAGEDPAYSVSITARLR